MKKKKSKAPHNLEIAEGPETNVAIVRSLTGGLQFLLLPQEPLSVILICEGILQTKATSSNKII